MLSKPYLFFDAGGTLVFPDQAFLIQQAQAQGLTFSHDQLFSSYCRLIYQLDLTAQAQTQLPQPWPHGYAHALLELLAVAEPAATALIQACQLRHQHKSLWAFTFPWVAETLTTLAGQGYRMSVISNSDGRTHELLREVGLAHYFEYIFDSELLGVEKPDPAIFTIALRELGLQPVEALYIGDVFHIDVVGANLAGIGALHLDPLGLYQTWPGVHLPDVCRLPAWLTQYATDPATFNLFPQNNRSIIS